MILGARHSRVGREISFTRGPSKTGKTSWASGRVLPAHTQHNIIYHIIIYFKSNVDRTA